MQKLYYNGIIVTVDRCNTKAQAVLLEDEYILAVGQNEEVAALAAVNAEKIDLGGKTMLPGFIDAHSHICNPLSGFATLPETGIDSKDMLKIALKGFIEKDCLLDNGWLIASGYENSVFENNAHPTRYELDEVSTEVPIVVLHKSGHIGAANSKALALGGYLGGAADPEGGVVCRDPATGEPTGVLEENAIIYLFMTYSFGHTNQKLMVQNLEKTLASYAKVGVTTAQEGGSTRETVELLKHCSENGKLLIDVVAYPAIIGEEDAIPDHSDQQIYHDHLKIGGVKIVGDGSPQAKTAWMTEPYYEQAENAPADFKGYGKFTDEEMLAFCRISIQHHWQMLVHCNGDAMGDQFIRTYRQAEEELNDGRELRPVMIHAQTVREDQLDAMKAIGMMPSFFHDHVYYWGDYHYASVFGPERGSRISPLYSAQRREMPFTLHNDTPVTPINPIFNIHVAVNRRTRSGMVLGPEYTVDVMEAIRAVTIYAAYQYFDEKIKGSIEPGKLADLVILDQDPLAVPKDKIQDIRVLETIKDGKTIYRAD